MLAVDDNGSCLGADWYCRITTDSLFKIAKPPTQTGLSMGIDALPEEIKNSPMLTGNNLGLLALVKTLPSHEEVEAFSKTDEMKEILDANMDTYIRTTRIHLKAKQLLENGRVMDAWKVLLM